MSNGPLRSKVRELLRSSQHADGRTAAELAVIVGHSQKSVLCALKAMPDAYIDRWRKPSHSCKYAAVWCCVAPPQNCPHPNRETPQ